MTFWQFWCALLNKAPKLGNPNSEVTIKSSEFQKLLHQAYKLGADSKKPETDFGDLFGGMFGKGK